jgi:hypothetical protein
MSKKETYIEKSQAQIEERSAKPEQLKVKLKGETASIKIEGHSE